MQPCIVAGESSSTASAGAMRSRPAESDVAGRFPLSSLMNIIIEELCFMPANVTLRDYPAGVPVRPDSCLEITAC
jgi:hypothetical protein